MKSMLTKGDLLESSSIDTSLGKVRGSEWRVVRHSIKVKTLMNEYMNGFGLRGVLFLLYV